ncbi:helix-turn-helix domain-containing protein [Confluentibacter flavum]|nr:helix-turn-helix domain-containing protein [Confluentibacter flavum]
MDYRRFQKEDLIHFIYPCLILALNLLQEYLHILEYQLIEDMRFVTIVMFFILYIILSYKILNKNLWKQPRKDFVDPRHDSLIKNWTYFIFIMSSLMFFRIIYSIGVEKISNEPLQAYRFSIMAVVPWLLIYGKILITPEILYGYPRFKKRKIKDQEVIPINDRAWIYDESTISNFQKEILKCGMKKRVLSQIITLEDFIHQTNPFRNTNVSIHNFANFVDLPTSHLHYIFKYHSVMSFEEYKVSCMANDAKKLIEDNDFEFSNLESLSLKVGFTNYTTFVNAFKEQTGREPEEYLIWKKQIEEFEFMPYA